VNKATALLLSAAGLAALAVKNRIDAAAVLPPESARPIHVDGLRLYVIEQGPADARAVVLLHGSAGSCWSAEQLLPFLTDRYRVVVPERPGQGWSDPPRSYRLASMTETVYEALRLLGVERPILVGWSYGGGVAMRMAIDHPGFADGLLLLASDGPTSTLEGHSEETTMRLATTLLTKPLLGPLFAWTIVPYVVRRFFARALDGKFGPDRPLLSETYVQRAKQIYSRPGIILAAAKEWLHEEEDVAQLEPYLSSIRVPVWSVSAELDSFVPQHVAEDLARLIPGARHVRLPGAPHGFPESRPEETARLLDAFVTAVGGRKVGIHGASG